MANVAHFRKEPLIVVLGAGASRGEDLNNKNGSLPPLNADFFTQLQRICKKKHDKTVSTVIKDINRFFGVNWKLTLEEYFTQIEFFKESLKYDKKLFQELDKNLSEARKNLLQGLSAVLEETIPLDAKHPYHDQIAEMLKSGDAILSFNYDTLIDLALKGKGKDKWEAGRKGYGFPSKCKVSGEKFWNPESNTPQKQTLKLLKMHGSIHWKISKTNKKINKTKRISVHLKQRTHKQKDATQFSIIPPEWNKSGKNDPIFQNIWSLAAEALNKARMIVLVGYSFSDNDLHSLALFRLAVKKNKLRRIVIVNPDQNARKRTRNALFNGIGPETIISQFDTLKEFCHSDIYKLLKNHTEPKKIEATKEATKSSNDSHGTSSEQNL